MIPRQVFRSLGAPTLAGLMAASATIFLSHEFANHETQQIARIIETVSYKTRSELARRIETRQRVLRDLAELWATFEDTPEAEWESHVQLEKGLLSGIEFLAWSDPTRDVWRYATLDDDGRRPTEAEWRSIQADLAEARAGPGASMTGPFFDAQGRASYRVLVPAAQRGDRSEAALVAQFSAPEVLHTLLEDEAPGYAIRVVWNEREIYRRNAAAADDLPEGWQQEGAIRLPFGAVWRVSHAPTPELVARLRTSDANFALLGGLALSLALAALTLENQRARRESKAAHGAEEKLRELNLELEDRVARRTQELEEALAELNAFNSFVSHDLKSPLGAILNFTEILQEDHGQALEPSGLDHLARIQRSAQSGLDRIEGLMALSRIGRAGLKIEHVDTSRLVADAFSQIHLEAGSPAVKFELHDLPTVQADRGLLQTAFVNLLSNAVKFTREVESPRIEVGGEIGEQEVSFTVRDNGPGFDDRQRDKLFEPFQRLHPGTVEGHGLGLAIVERVVRRHGGRAWAESRSGTGATFHLALPRAPATGRESPPGA